MTTKEPSSAASERVEAEELQLIQQSRILSANQRNLELSASKKVADQIDALCNLVIKLRAALTLPQEVAAPVGFGPDENGIVWPVPAMTTPSPNLAEYFSAPQVRQMIAASRPPVASPEPGSSLTEPVAWIDPTWGDGRYTGSGSPVTTYEIKDWTPLYTHPATEQGRAGDVGAVTPFNKVGEPS